MSFNLLLKLKDRLKAICYKYESLALKRERKIIQDLKDQNNELKDKNNELVEDIGSFFRLSFEKDLAAQKTIADLARRNKELSIKVVDLNEQIRLKNNVL